MRTCKNCKSRYTIKFNYCPYCGSKWIDQRLTTGFVKQEISERYLGTDNRLLITLKQLLTKPSVVIANYLNGQRKKYVNVINFFVLSLSLLGLQILFLKKVAPASLNINLGGNLDSNEAIFNFIYDTTGFFTALFIPVYALVSKLVFIDKKEMNFLEHCVLIMYVYGLYNFIIVALTPLIACFDMGFSGAQFILFIFIIGYIGWSYKDILRLSWLEITARGLLATIAVSVVQLIIVLILAVVFIIIVMVSDAAWAVEIQNQMYGTKNL